MTITREQVADLQPGDVVEYSGHPELRGAKLVGPLHIGDTGSLCIADYVIRSGDGSPSAYRNGDLSLTVISRAPRPLYVNHPRTEPVTGDVVRDADEDRNPRTWTRNTKGFSHEWLNTATHTYEPRDELPARLRLLVDGETGQVVP